MQSPTTTDQKAGADKSSTDTKAGDTKSSAADTKGSVAAPPAEKQSQIASVIKSEKVEEVTNVNFNISIGTVESRLHRAREALAKKVKKLARELD